VFEGIDSSGKETQARLLTNYLQDIHKTVAAFSFPNYDSFSGKRIKEWLHNKSIMNQYEVNMLYSLNRYEMKDTLEQCIYDYDYIILDRYYHSNWVYGGFMEAVNRTWLEMLDIGLPNPDLVFLLDIPAEISIERSGSMADIHERDSEFLKKCRKRYMEYAAIDSHWRVVYANDRPENIHIGIIDCLKMYFKDQLTPAVNS
jgi:dTMP kinase